jgi:hypothetical protein
MVAESYFAMADKKRNNYQNLLDKLMNLLLGLPWIDIVGEAWKLGRQVLRTASDRSMYEVLEYESTLELKDRGGKRAAFQKREKVRYLQDSIIAYQDQAWGDGEILIDYCCTPGTPVDRYRSGHKTYVLISRREVKNKGDMDEFNIEWRIRQGFLRRTEQWKTHIKHRMRFLKINVIFPKSRPPQRITLIESNRQRSRVLEESVQVPLPDGRWLVTWETRNPRLHENYILQWIW